jgi:Uma2 family endonuclease
MALPARHRYTVQEYLELDDFVETKLEYWHGDIYAMAGGQLNHNRICANLIRVMGTALDGGPCEPLTSDQRVRTTDPSYVYPDVVVACAPELVEERSLVNPVVLVEVLSASTEDVDREHKLPLYREIASVMDVLLVAQDRVSVEHWSRGVDGWSCTTSDTLDRSVRLVGVPAVLPLREVYRRVFA